MLLSSILVSALLAFQVAAQTCSSTSRCKEGCCNKFGNCGYGPDFCGKDACISDCDRKAECNPGYGAEWAQRDKCPLNVCCSEHGFCGTTKLFCGDKKVTHKTCSKDSGNARVIGYFEGWASNRPCNVFRPEQIPLPLYTHINFAFATIDPQTFKVLPAAESDIGLYKRLMLLKKKDPDLKIFIAIGGWTFNDPGPTATTFSDIAASVPRQKVFIDSLMSFMSTYGFDGVDLDWEYPGADDRSGRPVDFANFPKFMSRLKDSLDSAKKGVSITIPASYWYLQHFDLKALAKTVHWFNVMSYDLHGTWDKGNQWTGNFLNAHSNLTEIKDALDLIWRNDISPNQVVMGVGFYGRAFTATSPSCMEPGCTFESGAERGACSREVGILLNSEIDDLVKKNGVTPKLYKEETVKVASWADQWVAYDDEETFKLKSEFAQTQCLGGLMVWAISHDTKDAKYNKAFAKAVNRKILSLPMTDGSDEAYEFVDIQNEQCKWTNCGAPCPSGWVHMKREDGGARKNEYMLDQTGCNGMGVHAFCCPPSDKLPSCGWYNHHNGKCKSECPAGMGLVGGNNMYCNNGGYQAACCTQDVRPIKLYTKCSLGMWPFCDEQEGCPGEDKAKDTLLAASGSGMGGSICLATGVKNTPYGIGPGGKRKICCDTSKKKETFSDCEWYDYSGHDWKIKDHCDNNCPDDKVRIALDTIADGCKTGGKARCCSPNYFDTIEVENPKLDDYRDEVNKYLLDPTCSNPGSVLEKRGAQLEMPLVDRRSVGVAAAISRRATAPGQSKTQEMCLDLITLVGTSTMLEAMETIWNESFGKKFTNLKVSSLRQEVKKMPEYETSGPIQVCHDITCSPYSWNNRLGGSSGGDKEELDCTTGFCALGRSEDAEHCDGATKLRRRHSDGWMSYPEPSHTTPTAIGLKQGPVSVLVKRIRTYSDTLYSPDGRESFTIVTTLPDYYGFSQLDPTNPIFDEMVDFESVDDCGNLRLTHVALPMNGNNGRFYEMEHVFDGNLIGQFMTDAAAGRLRSGATAQAGPVSMSFFRQVRTMPLPLPPPLPGGFHSPRLLDRVMECLGSQSNTASFVGAHQDINAAKTPLMQGMNPISPTRWTNLASDPSEGNYVLMKLRAAIANIYYLNRQTTPNVNGRLTTVVNNVGVQWEYAEQRWNQDQANTNDQINLLAFWREWNRDFFNTFLINHTRDFVQGVIDEMRKYWGVMTGTDAFQMLETLRTMEAAINNLSINTANFD